MSKRNHHRNGGGINVNDLAEALTRNGWQQPTPGGNHQGQVPNNQGFPGMNMGNSMGNNQLSNNLGALGSLLGAVGGGQPQMPMGGGGMSTMPISGGMPQMNNAMPQMPMGGGMPQMPMPGMMPQHLPQQQLQQQRQAPSHQTTDIELIKSLFQEILKLLKEK